MQCCIEKFSHRHFQCHITQAYDLKNWGVACLTPKSDQLLNTFTAYELNFEGLGDAEPSTSLYNGADEPTASETNRKLVSETVAAEC